MKYKSDSPLGVLFDNNFRVLDSVVNSNPKITEYYNCPMEIKFMEKNTEIPTDGEGTFIGRVWFSKANWKAWHKWYNKHFSK